MNTLQQIESQISALNDLIRINNDRIKGYKKRIDFAMDSDLDEAFSAFIYQSRKFVNELTLYVRRLGGQPADGTSLPGKFYLAWTDIRSNFVKKDRDSLIDYTKFSEEVAASAYSKALKDGDIVWSDWKMVVMLLRHLRLLNNAFHQAQHLRSRPVAS